MYHGAITLSEKKVLVVDDQVFTQKILAIQLKKCGLEHIQALSGGEGIDKSKSCAPDLITLDYMMPDMNGLEVLKALKSDPKTSNIPVMMLSGMDNPEFKEDILKNGAMMFINKPIVGNHLINMIKFIMIKKEISDYDENRLCVYLNDVANKNIGIAKNTKIVFSIYCLSVNSSRLIIYY